MYDKALIQRVCDLTCSRDDVIRNQTTIQYDTVEPFKKYYSIITIKGAIEKFISQEWDDRTLAHWACIYSWVLTGGCSNTTAEHLTPLQRFLDRVIVWDLDGLSFFCVSGDEDHVKLLRDTMQVFENYDHILKTCEEWRIFDATIGPHDEDNGARWVLLINDTKTEYMILYSDRVCEDAFFNRVKAEEFIRLVEDLKSTGYTVLTCSEEYYYDEIAELCDTH